MHGVHVHLGEQRSGSSDYQRNKDVAGLAKLTYVTGPDEPCDVGGEVRPPKAVDDVCSCGEVSVMSGSIVSGGENCWSFVTVYDNFVMTLQIPSPKTAIELEKVFGVPQEGGICGIGESRRTFGGLEPLANTSQMVVRAVGSVGTGEQVVGERFDECRPIVGDDLAKSAPSAQYVFEDPISDGLRSLCAEGTIFGEMHQGAAALYEVLEAT